MCVISRGVAPFHTRVCYSSLIVVAKKHLTIPTPPTTLSLTHINNLSGSLPLVSILCRCHSKSRLRPPCFPSSFHVLLHLRTHTPMSPPPSPDPFFSLLLLSFPRVPSPTRIVMRSLAFSP